MVVWEDAEFTSPHKLGHLADTGGDLNAQGDGRNCHLQTGKTWGDWGARRRGGRTGPEGWLRRKGFPHLERRLGPWIRRSTPSISPAQLAGEVCPAMGLGTPSEAPSGPRWSWGNRREAEGEQERQAGGALQDWRSRWRVEGVGLSHLGPGSLLGTQVGSTTLWD